MSLRMLGDSRGFLVGPRDVLLAQGVPELLSGNLAGPQGMFDGFLGSLGGIRKFLGGPG